MHIYKREFVRSQGSHLILPAGETNQCWAIGFPPEGEITRFILYQNGGSPVQGTVNLFDRAVCDIGSASMTSLAAADPMTVAMARIFPEQSLSAGQPLELYEGDGDGPYPYRNREGTFTVPVRAVYLHVAVESNNDGKAFELALVCRVAGETN